MGWARKKKGPARRCPWRAQPVRSAAGFIPPLSGVRGETCGRRLGDRAVTATASDGDDPAARLHAFGVRLVRLMLSDEAVGLHRLVIGEAARFPELATRHYLNGSQRYIGVLCDLLAAQPPGTLMLPADGAKHDLAAQAEALFTQLLGERHRRRLFGLDPAPADADIDTHVTTTLGRFVTGVGPAPSVRPHESDGHH